MRPDIEEFATAWDEFVIAVRRAQGRHQRDSLPLSQYHLLSAVADEPGVPAARLADRVGIAAPTATRVLDTLERADLVRRERCPHDRRVVRVSLTDQGRRAVRARRRELARKRAALFERLDVDERRNGARLLRHLAELLEDF